MADQENRNKQYTSIQAILQLAADNHVETVDLKFVDLLGRWHHLSLPAERLNESLFESGVGFDGSSVPGYGQTTSSDMSLFPLSLIHI